MLLPGILASGISGHLITGNYYSIQTATVDSGGTSSITFSSIPQTYTHLQLRFLQLTSGSDVTMILNSDSGTNYNIGHQVRGDGSSATAAALGAGSYWYLGFTGSGSSYCAGIMDLLDYTNTNKYKTNRQLIGFDANGSGYVALRSDLWLNTNAVTSLTITPSSGTISQYSQFALYGIR